jgi:hypothetical protein
LLLISVEENDMKLGSLNYNTRSEEGEVSVIADLTKPDIVMLDILGDWIALLTIAYEDLHKLTYPEGNKDGE